MGIFRAGVRVTRALTPTPSSSSSDDEEPRAKKKCKTRKSTEKVSNVGAHHSMYKDEADLFRVGDTTCQLPEDLFELSHLGEVLSLETWNSCLSEEERERLCVYLPGMDQESYRKTLKELFGRQNMHFGSPLEVLWQSLKEGLCDPNVVRARQTLNILQRKDYYHDLRQYHNGMVNSLVEMRELWASDPEANLEERLSAWNARKSSEAQREASAGRLQMKPLVRSTTIVDDGVARLGTPLSDTAHGLPNNAKDVITRGHLSLEPRQGSEIQGSLIEMKKDRSHADSVSVAVPNPYDFDGMKKQSTIDTCIKHKREFDYRETGHRMSSEERAIESQVKANSAASFNVMKVQRKIEQGSKHDRHVKGHNREVKAPVFSEYEDAQRPSLVKAQHHGYRDIGFKCSETVAKEPNMGAYMKKCNNRSFDMQVASSSEQAQLLDDHANYGDATLIPSFAAGSSFSTLHLFSAVRAVLVDGYIPDRGEIECLPFREIVTRVQARPGDPRILEVQLPLDGLVKGVLKTLSSTSKKLKPFVAYDKSIRCWSWTGPVTSHYGARQGVDVRSFPEIWSTPAAILDELQDAFGKWLKNTEKTLQQLWQLALLPLPAYPVLPDEHERFRDLRAQKSLTTIFPSSYEMRALFRKEELVRYSALEIAFCYTTADGQKSAVAPLRRMGAKSKAKARDHFMLKPDRPSHITILCLVRDAAARLPQSIGTRADVCILLRDSQFIVEDVPELQLSQVVSGALDRLHYEKDPCVRYDSDKKLWLYLHGDREEEDFEEGGTASTRSSRRSKKDGAVLPAQGNGYTDDTSEPEPDSGSFNGNGCVRESASPELLYDHHQNGGPSSMEPGVVGGHTREEVLFDLPASMQPFCGNMQSHPMGWEVYKAGKELSITQ